MKKYKYKFSILVLSLLIAGLFLASGCIVWNIIRVAQKLVNKTEITIYNYLSLIVILILSVAFIVVAISMFISSYYEVKKNQIVLHWGIIKNTIEIKTVKEIIYNSTKNTLCLRFADEGYFVILVKKEWYEDFVDDIKKVDHSIMYTIESNEPQKK